MRLVCILLVMCVSGEAVAVSTNYVVDPSGAAHIGKMAPHLPTADRILIFVSGPENQGNLTLSPGILENRVPNLVVTNRADVARIFALLRPRGNKIEKGRIPAPDGYTYHLLAFDDKKKEVFHIRVFDSGLKSTSTSQVFLYPGSPFSYLNDEVAPWLRTNVLLNR